MSPNTAPLRPLLNALISEVQSATAEHSAAIAKVTPNHRAGAVNLVRYLALRNHDVVSVQDGLSALGATSLSHPEPAVLDRLHAAHNVLDAYDDVPPRYPLEAISTAYASADSLLEANTDALLGEPREGTYSRIMVTLPREAADDYELVLSFAAAGMELARINCAHDDADVWAHMVDNVHRAAEEVGREIKISCDIAGPKVRTGSIAPGPRVIRVRCTQSPAGELLAPAVLVLSSTPTIELPDVPLSPAAKRPAVHAQADEQWLSALRAGATVTCTEARGRARTWEVAEVSPGWAVLHGERNAYLAEGTTLHCEGRTATVSGIPPLEQKIHLHQGDELVLSTTQDPALISATGPTTIGCTAPEAVTALEEGQRVLFDDGAIEGVVKQVRHSGQQGTAHEGAGDAGDTEAVVTITRAGLGGTKLAAFKGINLPDTDIPLPSLTEEDLEALRFVATHCEIAAISFIRTAHDVEQVLACLERIAEEQPTEEAARRVRELGVVLKIETVPAYEYLGSILLALMQRRTVGLMIARGDLAVELGFEQIAQVPGRIMKVAEAAHIPVIMATQILENLAKTGLPSRAEITDAGYALRAECVMLNKGPHITEAITILDRMSHTLGRSRLKNRQRLRQVSGWKHALD
ncbi:pyruvate kinase [Corynebacterium sp.]|uniref:pyruvate kinase n=1 Tax=Corynebacterium sp. TaxID=1720 RepID=UPI0026DB09B9|nr:pyruvate kinase [Corynebacterium sp.]MDO5031215.1 pyruvate kinase [Corynebacterium sp.]